MFPYIIIAQAQEVELNMSAHAKAIRHYHRLLPLRVPATAQHGRLSFKDTTCTKELIERAKLSVPLQNDLIAAFLR